MKKILIISALVFGVLIFAGAGLMTRLMMMTGRLNRALSSVERVELSAVPDGVYIGEMGDFLVSAKVEVSVAANMITGVRVLEQSCGPGYDARDIPGRIVRAQSPRVDVVSGSSASSKAIMIAVHRALTSPR
jgi:uncharacterized protein with FMN-binding domain